MLERIQETAAFLKGKMHTQPETAIILGTGLGSLAGEITEKYEIRYEEIPNFPISTVEGPVSYTHLTLPTILLV